MIEEPSNGSSCFGFTRGEFDAVQVITIAIAGSAIGACCLAVLLIVLTKAYKLFVHRLALYLIVATLSESLTFILISIPVTYNDQLEKVELKNGSHSEALCKAAGFLLQYTSWVLLLLVSVITLYLLLLVVGRLFDEAKKHIYEVIGALVSLLLPLTFIWIPFIDDMYGLAGPWCWIRSGPQSCKEDFTEGAAYQFGIWYAPATFLLGVNSLIILGIILLLCKRAWHARQFHEPLANQRRYKEALKEAFPLVFYTLTYSTSFFLAFANRILQAVIISEGKRPIFSLWIVHAVIYSSMLLIIPLGFILHPHNLRGLCKRVNELRGRSTYTTEFIVSAESSSDSEVLVIKGRSGDHLRYQSAFQN